MTKSELYKRCKDIWLEYDSDVNETISIEDQRWLIENVFRHHPQWGWWNKQGIDHIVVGRSNNYGSPCYYIHFVNPIDKKCADISWVKSINNIK